MEDKKRGLSDYNWSYTGSDASQYRTKYTQGFDPQYLQHAAERKRQQQEEEVQRKAKAKAKPKRQRPVSHRTSRLARQQEVITRVDDTPIEEQMEALEVDQEIYAEERPARKKAQVRSRRRRAALRKRRMRMRIAMLVVLAVAGVFIALLIANKHELTITMAGSDPLYVNFGEVFTDPGATAEYKGTIFHSRDREVAVTSMNDVDTSKYGTYRIKYHASYKDKEVEETRTVLIRDKTAPEIQLDASAEVVMNGQPWKDSFTATDDQDGDITSQVQVIGDVDTTKNGTYEVEYRVVDASGNVATAKREVIVSNYQINNPGLAKEDGSNVIYLTFDDGPGPYTEELLEILNRFNVKATFFVTNQWPEYITLLKEEHEKGHAIGNHTASHDYGYIYGATDQFWEDYAEMDSIIEQYTGSKPTIFRFPGGSSNTASDDETMMTNLSKQSAERKLTYYDWTIISGDSAPPYDENTIYNAITMTLEAEEKPDCLMILCHDLIEETVLAMRDVIPWCLEHGYVFMPITEATPVIHHSINY